MSKKILGVFFDSYGTHKAEVRTVPDRAEQYSALLTCEYIDIPRVMIDGVEYDVIADDESLYRNGREPHPAIVDKNGRPLIFGPVFICRGNDSTGTEEPLTPEDVTRIFNNIKHKRIVWDQSGNAVELDILFNAVQV